MKPILFSIHGIRTDGAWQKGAAIVVDPFFDYRPVTYQEYRSLAITKLAGDVISVVCAVCIAIAIVFTHRPHPGLFWWVYAASWIAVIGVFHVFSRLLMFSAVKKVYKDLIENVDLGNSPSVVAHSLGTLLLCTIFQRFEGIRFDKIILDGCVVRRKFPWADMTSRFHSVFNEMGGRDPVPYFAGILRLSVYGMGAAGALGFSGEAVTPYFFNPSKVGPISAGYSGCCSEHQAAPLLTCVHNIRHKHISHSGYHTGVTHAKDFWLPRLLGLDPVLYVDFYQACKQVCLNENSLLSERRDSFEALKGACFGWTKGTLEKHTTEQLNLMTQNRCSAEDIMEMTNAALFNLSSLTDQIVASLYKTPPSVNDKRWYYLDPRLALHKSLSTVFKEALESGIIEV